MNINITLDKKTAEEAISYGLRQNWLDGEDETGQFSLAVGAGLGSPWLILQVDGQTYTADMRQVVTDMINNHRGGEL